MFKLGDVVKNIHSGMLATVLDASVNCVVLLKQDGKFSASPTDEYEQVLGETIDTQSFVGQVCDELSAIERRASEVEEASNHLRSFMHFYCKDRECSGCAFSDGVLCCANVVLGQGLK